jgi:hypothetical protein
MICESMTSPHEMKAIFKAIRGLLDSETSVKDFNQEIRSGPGQTSVSCQADGRAIKGMRNNWAHKEPVWQRQR